MSWWYRHLIRPVLFAQDAEEIHNRTMRGLAWAGRHKMVCDALASFFGARQLPVEVFGLKFPNPVGLAAGMDKHAKALPAWPSRGFRFTELGAVTWQGQPDKTALDEILAAIQEVQSQISEIGIPDPESRIQNPESAIHDSLSRITHHALVAPESDEGRSRIPVPKPILVKVAPDLSFEALDE